MVMFAMGFPMNTRRNTKEGKKDGRACATFDVRIAEPELGNRVLDSVSRDRIPLTWPEVMITGPPPKAELLRSIKSLIKNQDQVTS